MLGVSMKAGGSEGGGPDFKCSVENGAKNWTSDNRDRQIDRQMVEVNQFYDSDASYELNYN